MTATHFVIGVDANQNMVKPGICAHQHGEARTTPSTTSLKMWSTDNSKPVFMFTDLIRTGGYAMDENNATDDNKVPLSHGRDSAYGLKTRKRKSSPERLR